MGERVRTSPVSVTMNYPKGKQKSAFCKQYGLNSIYAGKHWAQRKADKDYWYALVRHTLREHKIPPIMFDAPAEIAFSWDDRLDCSNHAYMGKMIEDALVGYILENDNRRFVKRIIHEFNDCGNFGFTVQEFRP